jgi:hypothetical protein
MRHREMRWPCDHPIVLKGNGWEAAGRIVNISTAGARVAVQPIPERGARLRIDLQGPPLTGEVRWARSGLVGLRFDRLLLPRELALVRKAGMAARRPPRRHLPLREMA